MIKSVMVINTSGKVRLCQFYEKQKLPLTLQQQLMHDLFVAISGREDNLCSFVDGFARWPTPDTRVVYRRYATLNIIFITDSSESCLAILDLIQVFVEVLDRLFKNVCELDFLFHSEKVQRALAEIVMGGMVVEMSKDTIVRHLNEMSRLEGLTATSTTTTTSGAANTLNFRGGMPSRQRGTANSREEGGITETITSALNLLWGSHKAS